MSGTGAIHGFRVQVLRTVQRLLELYQSDPAGDWWMEIESATDEKVDYAEYRPSGITRVVQVKASMPASTTRLSERDAVAILEPLALRYGDALEVVLESNRIRAGSWSRFPGGVDAVGDSVPTRKVVDLPSLDALEVSVREALARIRASAHVVADPQTLRHLAVALEGEVWRRGATPTPLGTSSSHRLGPQDVAAIVRLTGKALADRIGEVPWGRFWGVPSTDRVARQQVMHQMSALLPLSALVDSGQPAAVAITGFSGSGKSTVAAGWADAHQESYAFVLWLTARSDEALAGALRPVLVAEFGDEVVEWPDDQVRNEFRSLLGRTPLSWLLVLDDAASNSVIANWMPSRGYGHIVVTTRDSGWLPSASPSLPLQPMDIAEATGLVSRRTARRTDSFSNDEKTAIQRLVRATGGWPLAIDMVLAKLAQTGRGISDAQPYLGSLPDVLLDREDLVPPGYPRTVVAVVVDALDGIAPPTAYGGAWRVLTSCARLGANSVPVPLVHELLERTTAARLSITAIDDGIAVLVGLSLVHRQRIGGRIDPRWADRLIVNDIVADLAIRLDDEDLETAYAADEVLSGALMDAVDQRAFHLASSLADVAGAVIQAIAEGRRPNSVPSLALHGNLAIVHQQRGDFRKARELLLAEVQWAFGLFHADHPDPAVKVAVYPSLVQSLVQLAQLGVEADEPDDVIGAARLAVAGVSPEIAAVGDPRVFQWGSALADALGATRREDLLTARNELLARIAELGIANPMTLAQRVELALRQGQDIEAVALARQALKANSDPLMRLRLTCALAEAVAATDFDQALRYLASAATQSEQLGTGTSQVVKAVIDVSGRNWARLLGEELGAVAHDRAHHEQRWNALTSVLAAGENPDLPPGQGARTLLAIAIASTFRRAHEAPEDLAAAHNAIATLDPHASAAERVLLRSVAHWVSALHQRLNCDDVVDVRAILRSSGLILLGLERSDLDRTRRFTRGLTSLPVVDIHGWHAALSFSSDSARLTLWIDFAQIGTNPFDRAPGLPIVGAYDIAKMVISPDGHTSVQSDDVLLLGPAEIQLDDWALGFIATLPRRNEAGL